MKRRKTRRQKRALEVGVPPVSRRPVYLAFFLSGFAALMHQVVWAKLLVPLIGATAYAQAAVLAVFMGGLALGAVVFGRRSDRGRRPVRTYLRLEVAIGGYCLVLPMLLHLAGMAYTGIAGQLLESGGLALLLRFALVVLLILLPAVLMGATLPVLARHLVERLEETQPRVASLYALNAFGAVLGAGFAGFVALPSLGVYGALAVASGFNFVSAALVHSRARAEAVHGRESGAAEGAQARRAAAAGEAGHVPREPVQPAYRREQYAVALLALGLSGFAAMGYEVLATRIISLSFGSSAYSFTVMLMAFITGIGLGSAVISRFEIQRPLWVLGLSQLAVVVTLLLATPLIARMPYLIGLLRVELQQVPQGFEIYQAGKTLLCLAVLLAPTMCLGVMFPLVARVQARHPAEVGARVGSTYAWNTAGNVLGVIGTSLALLPGLGLLGAFHFNLALNLLAGAMLLVVASETRARSRALAAAAATGVAAVYLAVGTGWSDSVSLARNHLRMRTGPSFSLDPEVRTRHPTSSFAAWKQTFLAREEELERFYFDEDAHATVLVAGDARNTNLYVNSKPDASTASDLDTQLLLGHAPFFLAPRARSLLIVGHGSGITAGSALRHPLERVDIVEISPAVLRADAMFAEANYGVLDDPRVHTYVDDGQSFMRTVGRRYDVVISQPPNPWIAGVGGLFTVEYFESVRDRLEPGGVFGFWFHAYELSDEAVQLVLRTVVSVFPNIVLFADNDVGNLIAIASMEPIDIDFTSMERRFEEPAVRDDFARLGITNLAGFLSHHRMSEKSFGTLLVDGPLNTVAHQRLEYIAPRSLFSRENSFLIERFDPLVTGRVTRDGILLDRYIAYRAAAGRPVGRAELGAAARYARGMGGYGAKVSRSILGRAR